MRDGTYNPELNTYRSPANLDFSNKYFSDKLELENEVRRVYKASLGLKIQTHLFTGIDNYTNREEIDSRTPLVFEVVETPESVLFWWVTPYRLIPIWNIEPSGWSHPDYCGFLYETQTTYHLDYSVENE